MKISQVVFASVIGLSVGFSANLAQAEEKRNEGLPLFMWLTGQTAVNSAQTGPAQAGPAQAKAKAVAKPAAVVAAAATKPVVAAKPKTKNMKTWKSGPKVNTGRPVTSSTAAAVAPKAPVAVASPPVASKPVVAATAPVAATAKKVAPVKTAASKTAKTKNVRGGLAPREYSLADLLGIKSSQEPKSEQSAAAKPHAAASQVSLATTTSSIATPAIAAPALTEDATVIASVLPLVANQPVSPQKPKVRARKDMKTWKSHAKKAAIKKPSAPPGIDPKFARKQVAFKTEHPVGSIVVDTGSRYLYHVLPEGQAMRYGIGVGRLGFTWKGTAKIKRKAEWPAWHPPASMRKREPWLPVRMEGGPENPLGARALYLFQGSKDTLYRIHGTNNPASIGQALSSGCVRLLNSDVEHLYSKVKMGSKVVVL